MRVRYVALVPVEFEEDVIGNEEFMTQWGREYAALNFNSVASLHPRRQIPYEPVVVEAVKLDDAEPVVDLGDLIAPGLIA